MLCAAVAGSVYVYNRSNYLNWTLHSILNIPNSSMSAGFGSGVSVSNTTAMIGCYMDDNEGSGGYGIDIGMHCSLVHVCF